MPSPIRVGIDPAKATPKCAVAKPSHTLQPELPCCVSPAPLDANGGDWCTLWGTPGMSGHESCPDTERFCAIRK